MTEKELDAAVGKLCRLYGWRRYHTYRSKHSPAGFPDEVLLRPPRLVFAELKSEKGKRIFLDLVKKTDILAENYSLGTLESLGLGYDRLRELNPRLAVSGMVLTMHDGRTRLAQDVERELREHFPELVFDSVIPRNVRISEAPSFGVPVTRHDPRCSGSVAYLRLAKEVAARG